MSIYFLSFSSCHMSVTGSYTENEPTGNQAWINKLLTCIDPVPNLDLAISPVGEDIENKEINVKSTLNTQM